jgi:hypothetical protein
MGGIGGYEGVCFHSNARNAQTDIVPPAPGLSGYHGNVRVGRARGNAGRTNAGLSDKSVQRFDTLPRLPSESVAALPRIPHK